MTETIKRITCDIAVEHRHLLAELEKLLVSTEQRQEILVCQGHSTQQ